MLIGLLFIALASISWGTTGATMTLLAKETAIGPLLVGWVRVAAAAPCLFLAAAVNEMMTVRRRRRIRRRRGGRQGHVGADRPAPRRRDDLLPGGRLPRARPARRARAAPPARDGMAVAALPRHGAHGRRLRALQRGPAAGAGNGRRDRQPARTPDGPPPPGGRPPRGAGGARGRRRPPPAGGSPAARGARGPGGG